MIRYLFALTLAVVLIAVVFPQGTSSGGGGQGMVSVPAAAFQPRCPWLDYDNGGGRLITMADVGGEHSHCAGAHYLAPVYLPHGARVTGLHMRAYDEVIGSKVILKLVRVGGERGAPSGVGTLTEIDSTIWNNNHAPGEVDIEAVVSPNHVVDNSKFSYYLHVEMPLKNTTAPASLRFYMARVVWQYVVDMPFALNDGAPGR